MNDSDIIERLRALHAAVPGEPSSLDVRVAATPCTDHRGGRSILIAACAVVMLIGIGMVIRRSGTHVSPAADPSQSSSLVPSASSGHRSATVGLNVRCGDVPPMEVTVPDATSGALDGPAGGAVAIPATGPSQLIRHWDRPDGSVEVRWPADPRPLYDPRRSEAGVPLVIGGMSSDAVEGTLKVYGVSPTASVPLVELHLVGTPPTLPPPCDRVQLRIAANGLVETVGLSNDLGADQIGFDLGPLIGPVSERSTGGPEGASIECTEVIGPTVPVSTAPIMASPAEALREFLAGPEGAPLDATMPQGPYHEYHVTADDTYHYEQYTQWNVHAAITVARTGSGWSVADWTSGSC
jgi:hypothetical protein